MRVMLLVLTLFSAAVVATDQEAAITEAASAAATCKPSAFGSLFKLSASGQVTGAHTSEELSEANERAFMKCPYEFLLALGKEPVPSQENLAKLYFGIRRPPWELGAELRKWQDNARVGQLVRARFGAFLSAKEPK